MQRADRSVRVPRAARAVLLEHAREALGVLGEMLERHCAVLDEGNRLAVAFHRHHDVEPGLAHFPNLLLQLLVGDLHYAAGLAEVGHELHEILQPADALVGELDEQDRVRVALDESVDRLLERGSRARGRSSCGRRARPPWARA